MSRQLPLALCLPYAPALDEFVVGRNQVVVDALHRALDTPGESLVYLFGPAGCGRSHLLLGQCAAAERRGLRCAFLPLTERAALAPQMLEGLEALDLVAVDDVQAIAGDPEWEEALFGLFNRCRDCATRMVFSANCGPAALPLQPLDDAGRMQLLRSLAARRALALPEDVARYLLERTPRHPRDLVDTVARLDQASLAEKRRLTIPFVRDSLGLK